MKFIRYGKYVGEPADAIDLEELIKRLGDFFLQSGFESQFYGVSQMDPERSMEALREAILRALQQGDLLPEDAMSDELREMLRDPAAMNSQAVKDLLDKLTERLANEGFINPQQPPQVTPPPHTSAPAQLAWPQQLWPPRHPRPLHRRRIRRRLTPLRIRRHSQHGHQRHALQRRPPRRRKGSYRDDLLGPHGPSVRIPKLLRYRGPSRLQPQHDSLRRRSLHARQTRRHGTLASHSHAVSRRLAQPRPLP